MQEIERKFLVKSQGFKQKAFKKRRITQGYLSTDPERTVRVRVRADDGFITVKGKSNESGTTRTEVEERISKGKAKTLLTLCLPGIVDKTRYEVDVDGHLWEVDEFHGESEGLLIAEIELESEDEYFEIPAWVGVEVTGDKKYYNSQLARNPYTQWK